MGELSDRRGQSEKRIEELRAKLTEAASLCEGKACVYMTGSYGRYEASPHSDLDLFILGKSRSKSGPDGKEGSLLSRLDQICLMADLIEATRELKFQEFSGDGRWLVHYSVDDLITTLGTPSDDVENTFTARLLLLLESRPLIGEPIYHELLDDVLAAYWRDYEDHKSDFIPAFLTNDILRLWRTFCVNYEARSERDPEKEKAKGKLKNYKLKHSRLLTCYSAILYLLSMYRLNKAVHPDDARAMIGLTPTERLETLRNQEHLMGAHRVLDDLIAQYQRFLETTNEAEEALISKFTDRGTSRSYGEAAYKFGDLMFKALTAIGEGNRFHRLIVV